MDQFKHMLDTLLGVATLANFFKWLVVGFSVLPTVLTLASTTMAIIWYFMQIRAAMKKKEREDEFF